MTENNEYIKMDWFGLTGGIATGKSTVAQLLSKAGAAIIDADILARKAVEVGAPAYSQIVHDFGTEVLNADKSLDRKKLAQILFNSKEAKSKIEEAIHPEVRKMSINAYDELADSGAFPIVYDVPLLFEKNMAQMFSGTVVVACDKSTQIERLMRRDEIDKIAAELKISSQLDMQKKIEKADFVIWNNGSEEDLKSEVDVFMAYLRED